MSLPHHPDVFQDLHWLTLWSFPNSLFFDLLFLSFPGAWISAIYISYPVVYRSTYTPLAPLCRPFSQTLGVIYLLSTDSMWRTCALPCSCADQIRKDNCAKCGSHRLIIHFTYLARTYPEASYKNTHSGASINSGVLSLHVHFQARSQIHDTSLFLTLESLPFDRNGSPRALKGLSTYPRSARVYLYFFSCMGSPHRYATHAVHEHSWMLAEYYV